MGGLSQLFDAQDKSGDEGLLREAERLLSLPEYADHDSLYVWLDDAYLWVHGFDTTMSSLRKGLIRCPRKSVILNRLGRRMLDVHLAAEAFYYWIQAVHNIESSKNSFNGDPYLFLGHVAVTLENHGVAVRFLDRADSSFGPPVRLESATEKKIETVFSGHENQTMNEILVLMSEKYL